MYGCGTYREPKGERHAVALFKRYFEKLGRNLGLRVPYFGAMERRYSGCGLSPIPLHWHFLAGHRNGENCSQAAEKAEDLWRALYGDAKVEPYDSDRTAPFYVSKLIECPNGRFESGSMELLPYRGPSDIHQAIAHSSYVPDHLKGKVRGQYLVLRHS
jgi:hypothetical protein